MVEEGSKMKSKILIYLISSIILLAGIIAPAAYLVYNSNPGLESLFFNSTENSNATGIRLSAPVLFMDFNLNSETTEQNGIRNNYIEDNSLYDNLGLEGMGTESVSNGDMESASVWSAYSSPTSQARSNEQAHSGTYSWKVVSPSGYKGFNQTLTLTSGKTYLLSYWIKNSSGVGGYCAILNSSGANTYNIQPSPITGGWDYVQQSITPNTAATNIIFLSPGGAATFYIDDVSIRENSRPTKNSTGGYDGSGAYMFDGVNDYMVIPSSSILSGTTKTLSIWVKLRANTSSGNNGMLFLGRKLDGL
jgi:hypothetical protein